MNLNIPDTRQMELTRRLQSGLQVVAAEVAEEFDVSLDTIRRDILALEAEGKARRVRGGAVPLVAPAQPLHERLAGQVPPAPNLVDAAVREIGSAATLMVDGGTTVLAVIDNLPRQDDRLVMTPSPWVAISCQQRGIQVFLLGGSLRPQGGIATGDLALAGASDVAVDIALLGACGLEAGFGLSSDDAVEAMMKRAMHGATNRTIVATDSSKIGRRARHRTLPLSEIDVVVTDLENNATAEISAMTRVVSR